MRMLEKSEFGMCIHVFKMCSMCSVFNVFSSINQFKVHSAVIQSFEGSKGCLQKRIFHFL